VRVCLVSRELAPYTGWGVGTYAAQMASALMRAGHEAHVLADEGPGVRRGPSHAHAGAEIHTIDVSRAMRHMPTRASDRPLAILERVRALHEAHDFDLIEFADVYADAFHVVQAKRTLGEFESASIAVRLHSPIFLLRRLNRRFAMGLYAGIVEHMEAEAIRGADLVLAPSRAIIDRVTSLIGPLRASWRDESTPVYHHPNPIDPRLLAGEAHRASPAPRRSILAYGRLEHRKGFHLLVEAAARLLDEGHDIDVRIHGTDTRDSPGRRSVRDQLERLVPDGWADRFIIEGNLSREELAGRIVNATVCCFPSLWENYPYACLEAMSLGALVVGSDAGGMAEMIEHDRSGLLFRSGDVADLTKQLGRALGSEAVRTRAADLAPKRVREISDPGRVAERLETIVGSLKAPVLLAGDEPDRSVSVVIAHKDMPETLEATVGSVLRQTRPADEIILVDDGSETESALEVVDRLEHEHAIVVIRQANAGLAAARNAGIRHASSEFVVPLDADDLLALTFLERTLAAVSREPDLEMVTTLMACFRRLPTDPEFGFAPIGLNRELIVTANTASSCTALLRRQSVLDAGAYDESLWAYEDWDLYCAMASRDMRCALVPEHLVQNRVRDDSMLRSLHLEADHALRATILAKHPSLASAPDRAMRLLLSEWFGARGRKPPEPSKATIQAAARGIVESKARYRLADKALRAARRSGLLPIVKVVARPFLR